MTARRLITLALHVAACGSGLSSTPQPGHPHRQAAQPDVAQPQLAVASDPTTPRIARDGAQCPRATYRWCKAIATGTEAVVRALAPRPDGGWIIVGAFQTPLDLGGGARVSQGGLDGFVLALGSTGDYQWDYVFGGTGDDLIGDVAIGAGGQVVVTGGATVAIDLGGGMRRHAGGADVFVLALSPQGRRLWDVVLGGPGYDFGRSVAFLRDGSIVIAGHMGDTKQLDAAAANVDVLVLALEPDGRERWRRSIESTGWGSIDAVVAVADSIVAVGRIEGDVTVGDKVERHSSMDALVVSYTPNGDRKWFRTLGTAGSDVATDVATTPGGDLVVVGHATATTVLGFVHVLDATGRTRSSDSLPTIPGWVTVRSDGTTFVGDRTAHGELIIDRTAADGSGAVAVAGYITRGHNRDLFVFVSDDPAGPRAWPTVHVIDAKRQIAR